jgi:uncharacterized protein (DUF1786 family)
VSIRGDSYSEHGHGCRRLLAVDVGAGTTDVLVWQEGRRPENSEKLVAPSATVVAGRRIEDATRRRARVVFRGPTMGGGACTVAARRHLAAGCDFLATETAASTFADDLRKVGDWGVHLVGEDEAQAAVRAGADDVRSGDVDAEALLEALERLGVDVGFSAVAVAAQDHGFNPAGSNRVFRFETWRRAIAAALPLASLFYDGDAVPAELTRLRAAAGCFAGMRVPLLAGDTGPAALLGVAPEDGGDAALVNVGNGHTIFAVSVGGRLAGVFEHHTGSLDGARLDSLLRRFLAGEVRDEEIREDGGHGALLQRPVPAVLPIFVTGPNRDLLRGSDLPLIFPAPFGDVMMAGPVGLLRAFLARPA